MFSSTIEEPRRRSGFSIWLAAAVALVFGIVIGFTSGYRAGKGASTVQSSGSENSAPTSGAAGRTFSESSVSEPVNLNAEPIVPAPETAGPPRGPERAAVPAPQQKAAAESAPQRKLAAEAAAPQKPAAEPVPRPQAAKVPAAAGRVPPRTAPADPSASALPAVTGPGSLQVVSRPAGAQVLLDGRSIGKTPMTIPDVAAGEHSVRLELPGFKRWATTTEVKAGSATRVAASLEQ